MTGSGVWCGDGAILHSRRRRHCPRGDRPAHLWSAMSLPLPGAKTMTSTDIAAAERLAPSALVDVSNT